jgi:hypothetical protein
MKLIKMKWSSTALMFVLMICGSCIFQEVPECPNKEELLEGRWSLVKVEINGQQLSGPLEEYSLVLEEFGIYSRIAIDGLSDGGSWSLSDNSRLLVIRPDNQPSEEYLIETFNLRTLTLFVDRDNNKIGPDTIKLFLERK